MKKKKILLFAGISLAFVLMAGCSSAPKEDEIKDDLAKCADKQLLSEGEVLDSIEITDRNTDKKQKTDSILCEVTTHKGDVSYEKGVEITYYKYDKNWELGNISVSDEDSWLMKPLKGVDAEVIADALVSERIMIDGQNWDIETGEIKNVTVDNRKSDLENNKEEISLTLTLDSGVEEAKGTLTADFEFDKNWEMVSCNPNDDFKVTPNQNKTLNLTEDDLIGLLSEQIFDYDENGIGKQEISVTKDQVSDFKIDNQKTINKGKYQEYQCSCTFSKANAVFGIEFTVESQYDSEWSSVVTSKKLQVESVDWAGKWTGRYNNVPYSGDVVLELNVDGDQVTGTYTYTPDVLHEFSEGGSYNVSGTVDGRTLSLRLSAGDWIKKPKRESSYLKQDIIISPNVNENQVKGQGHDSSPITLNK